MRAWASMHLLKRQNPVGWGFGAFVLLVALAGCQRCGREDPRTDGTVPMEASSLGNKVPSQGDRKGADARSKEQSNGGAPRWAPLDRKRLVVCTAGLEFLVDGRLVYTEFGVLVGIDFNLIVRDGRTGRLQHKKKLRDYPVGGYDISVSPKAGALALTLGGAAKGNIYVFRTSDFSLIKRIRGIVAEHAVICGNYLVLSRRKTVTARKLSGGKRWSVPRPGDLRLLSCHPKLRRVAISTVKAKESGIVELDYLSGKIHGRYDGSHGSYSPVTGDLYYVGMDNNLRTRNNIVAKDVCGMKQNCCAFGGYRNSTDAKYAFSGDGSRLVVCSIDHEEPVIDVYDRRSEQKIRRIRRRDVPLTRCPRWKDKVGSLALSTGGQLLAFEGLGCGVSVFDLKKDRFLWVTK